MNMYEDNKFETLKEHMDDLKPCLICGSTKLDIFASKGFFTAQKCIDCGMVSTNPYLTTVGVEKFYSTYLKMRQNSDPLFEARNEQYVYDLEFLQNTISSGSILDVGCSAGYFLSKFSDAWDKEGIDLTQDCADDARKFFNIKVNVGSISNFQTQKRYDVVSARGVIEHFKNPRELTNALPRLLKPGGYFYVCATPTSDNAAFELYRGSWRLFTPFEHVHFFNVSSLSELLGPKFEIVDVDYPYEGTPYCDFELDMLEFKKAYAEKSQGKVITAQSRSFPGAMINAIWVYKG